MTFDKQIGIGIVHCETSSGGFNKVFTSDNGQWSNLIDDTGCIFRYVKWNNDVILRMIKFVRDGWYLCSMKQVPGRDEEYRASWVFFPTSIELSQNDINAIVEEVESQIKVKDFDADTLRGLVRRYNKAISNFPLYSIPTNQYGFAYRYDGQYNTYDLYKDMYQEEFTKYEWVLLMPKESLTIRDSNKIKDISDMKIVEPLVIKPVQNPDGFIPYLDDGAVFSKPVIITGKPLHIIWKKNGYKDIPKEVKTQPDIDLVQSEYIRLYKLKNFQAKDAESKVYISGVALDFKGKRTSYVKGEECLEIKETEVSSVKFHVKTDGYLPEDFDLNLTEKKENDIITFELEREHHKYKFRLDFSPDVVRQKKIDKKYVTIEISSQMALTTSDVQNLIPGYTCINSPSENSTNNLKATRLSASMPPKTPKPNGGNRPHGPHPENPPKDKKRVGWYVVIIILLIIIGFCVWQLCGSDKHNEKFTEQPGATPQDDRKGDSDWDNAFNYS